MDNLHNLLYTGRSDKSAASMGINDEANLKNKTVQSIFGQTLADILSLQSILRLKEIFEKWI